MQEASYQHHADWASRDPEGFWQAQAKQLDWFTFPQTMLSKDDNGIERWFADGVTTIALKPAISASSPAIMCLVMGVTWMKMATCL